MSDNVPNISEVVDKIINPFTSRYVSLRDGKDCTVRYSDFDEKRLVFSNPKLIPENIKFGTPDYHQCSIMYEYIIGGKPIQQEFLLEGPTMFAPYGIGSVSNKKGEIVGYSMGFKLDVSNPEHIKFLAVLRKIYIEVCKFVARDDIARSAAVDRMSCGPIDPNTNFDTLEPAMAWKGCTHLIHHKKVEKGKREIIKDSPPFFYGNLKRDNGTIFTDCPKKRSDGTIPQPKEISRVILDVAAIECRPMIRFFALNFTKDGVKIKQEMKSAIVTRTPSKANAMLQKKSLEEMADDIKEGEETLDDQIAKLLPEALANMKVGDEKDKAPVQPPTQAPTSNPATAAANTSQSPPQQQYQHSPSTLSPQQQYQYPQHQQPPAPSGYTPPAVGYPSHGGYTPPVNASYSQTHQDYHPPMNSYSIQTQIPTLPIGSNGGINYMGTGGLFGVQSQEQYRTLTTNQ